MFKGDRVSVGECGKVPGADSGHGCTTVGMYSLSLNCTLKNGQKDNFDCVCILQQ